LIRELFRVTKQAQRKPGTDRGLTLKRKNDLDVFVYPNVGCKTMLQVFRRLAKHTAGGCDSRD